MRGDEVGELMGAFQAMHSTLREQTRQVIEGSTRLAAAVSQLSTTSSELATSSSETSTTIAEVSTTVEEVKQTTQLVTEKTQRMITGAKSATQISRQGKTDADKAIAGIRNINEEMEFIAESIIQLSEQTQNIGEIIEAVNDITDQSNMLAVNAAVEASKAGEFGKGFAVVAQEVKSLAIQSKEATAQIKGILNDIQKATSSAVMATERGSKSVEAGVALGETAGSTIAVLEQGVGESALAAEQIGASSQQQLAGMDQLVVAMDNIRQATEQNIIGAKQLEGAIHDLGVLAANLRETGNQFKL